MSVVYTFDNCDVCQLSQFYLDHADVQSLFSTASLYGPGLSVMVEPIEQSGQNWYDQILIVPRHDGTEPGLASGLAYEQFCAFAAQPETPPTTSPVPEPGTAALLILAALLFAMARIMTRPKTRRGVA